MPERQTAFCRRSQVVEGVLRFWNDEDYNACTRGKWKANLDSTLIADFDFVLKNCLWSTNRLRHLTDPLYGSHHEVL